MRMQVRKAVLSGGAGLRVARRALSLRVLFQVLLGIYSWAVDFFDKIQNEGSGSEWRAARWVSGLPRAEWGQSSVDSLFRFMTRLKPWDVVIFYFDPKGKWEGKLAAGNSVSLALFCVFLWRTGPSLSLLWPPAFLSLCPRHLPSRGESWRWAFSFLFFSFVDVLLFGCFVCFFENPVENPQIFYFE